MQNIPYFQHTHNKSSYKKAHSRFFNMVHENSAHQKLHGKWEQAEQYIKIHKKAFYNINK